MTHRVGLALVYLKVPVKEWTTIQCASTFHQFVSQLPEYPVFKVEALDIGLHCMVVSSFSGVVATSVQTEYIYINVSMFTRSDIIL